MSLALTEINHLKEIEALLIKSETSLRAIFDNVLDGIIRINEHGIIESINTATESLFGYSPEALLGSTINQLLPKLDWCADKNKLTNAGATVSPKSSVSDKNWTDSKKTAPGFLSFWVSVKLTRPSRVSLLSLSTISPNASKRK